MVCSGKNTFTFKDVFADYQNFVDWYNSTPFNSYVPSKIAFGLIWYEYADSHLAFSLEDFKNHFAIDLYTYAKEFDKTSEKIDKMMELTEDDISFDSTVIFNTADIPEVPSSTDIERVDFVSAQQKTLNKKGKLQISREMLSTQRAYTVKGFLKRFKHLFVSVCSPAYTFSYCSDKDS